MFGTESFDALVEGIEKMLYAGDMRWRMRKSAEEEQALVKADQLSRIVELDPCEFLQNFGNENGVARVKGAFGGLESSEQAVEISGARWHAGEIV
jgi:hypothetical protein